MQNGCHLQYWMSSSHLPALSACRSVARWVMTFIISNSARNRLSYILLSSRWMSHSNQPIWAYKCTTSSLSTVDVSGMPRWATIFLISNSARNRELHIFWSTLDEWVGMSCLKLLFMGLSICHILPIHRGYQWELTVIWWWLMFCGWLPLGTGTGAGQQSKKRQSFSLTTAIKGPIS